LLARKKNLKREVGVFYIEIGDIRHKLRQNNQALTAYGSAIEFLSDPERARCKMGIVYIDMHDFQSAIKCFDAATETNENYLEALIGKGTVHFRQDHYLDAKINYEKAVKAWPCNASAIMNWAISITNRACTRKQ
jgi:tetratricopeptide (TPR) repeat protein